MIQNGVFEYVGGMCNNFFGWGREDYVFMLTLFRKKAKVSELTPKDIGTNCSNTFEHIHTNKRTRDKKECLKVLKVFNCIGGIGPNHLKYELESVEDRKVGTASVTFLNVKLFCNQTETPWCSYDCSDKENTKVKK